MGEAMPLRLRLKGGESGREALDSLLPGNSDFLSAFGKTSILTHMASPQYYFFILKGLVDRLKNGALSAKESFFYLLATTAQWLIYDAMEVVIDSQETSSSDDFHLGVLGELGVTVVAFTVVFFIVKWVTSVMYRNNGHDEGSDFLPRLVALNFVIGCRLAPLTVLIAGLRFMMDQDHVFSDNLTLGFAVLSGVGITASVVY
jgi:hypothetical protein